jgi:hypothetical protein
MKKIRVGKPIGIIVDTYMEISPENSLRLPLSQTNDNVMFSILCFLFFLLQNQRTGRWNKSCSGGGLEPLGGGGAGESR